MNVLESLRLDGKKALVTGAAQGIGKAAATGFAEAGADVAIVDVNIAKAEETAKKIAAETGRDVFAVYADQTKPEDVKKMMNTILDRFGRLDIAFCNAGICTIMPGEEMTYEVWSKVIDVNLTGTFLMNQAAGQVMLKQGGGSIINTASMSGHIVNVPQPQCAYNASKAGVIQLTKSLAVEWAKKNVRVNCISPGYINTEILQQPSLKPLIEQWMPQTPIGRMGETDELKAILVFLASDTSKFATGSDIVIDGAFTCV